MKSSISQMECIFPFTIYPVLFQRMPTIFYVAKVPYNKSLAYEIALPSGPCIGAGQSSATMESASALYTI